MCQSFSFPGSLVNNQEHHSPWRVQKMGAEWVKVEAGVENLSDCESKCPVNGPRGKRKTQRQVLKDKHPHVVREVWRRRQMS